jgi:hypothetical protein
MKLMRGLSKERVFRYISIPLLLALIFLYNVPRTYAAVVGNPKDTLTRESASVAANHTIQFVTPTGVANGNTITLAFETGFNIASVVTADVTVEGAAVTSATPSGQTLTITCGASNVVAASGTVDIVITNNHITNPGSLGDYTVTIGGSFGDTGVLSVPITASGGDRIGVTGDIGFSITFSLSSTSCAFPTLTTGSVASCGPFYFQVGTTAGSGYTVTVQDEGSGSSPGLYKSSTATKLIATSNQALTAGTVEGYGLQAAIRASTPTIPVKFTQGGTTVAGLLRTADTIASSSGATTANHEVNVTPRASITAGTPAGSYGDTLTFLATGNF